MAVPTRITDFNATAASNSPAGTEAVGTTLDDYLRGYQAVVRLDLASKGNDISSASTADLGAVGGLAHDITGVTTIPSFGTVSAGVWKIVKFEGALTLTHNATSLILPGAANITTANGDIGLFFSEGSGNWRCVTYLKATPVFRDSFTSSDQTITAAGTLTLAHGLYRSPVLVQARLKCTSDEGGYAADDEVIINPGENDVGASANRGISMVVDATNITVRFGSDASSIAIMRKDTGAAFTATNANWSLIVRAWA